MSCIVLGIQLADKKVNKELGVLIDGKVRGYLFPPPKKYKPTKQAFSCTRNVLGLCGKVDAWITVSLQTFFLEMERVNTLQKD